MTLRISTAGLYAQGLDGLLRRQQALARTQQELVTGNKLTRAAQDPSGAAQAQRLDHAVASLEQYRTNAGLVGNRLRQQEQALSDGGDILDRVRELTVQANNATLSQDDRKVLAVEIRQLRTQLLAVANREDGNGRSLFAGQRDGVVPFASNGGVVSYVGDDGRNDVEIAPGTSVHDSEAGSDVFMRVRTGNGEVRGLPGAGNTGTGLLQTTVVADHAAWPRSAVTLQFTAPGTWDAVDASGTVIASGTYQDGDTLSVAGLQARISGNPAAGDSFTLAPAPTRDIFGTLDALATALEQPTATPQEKTRLANAANGALADLSTAREHFVRLRAAGGSALAALDHEDETRMATDESLRGQISELRDVDYAAASTQLAMHLAAVEAAQRTMLRIQSLSLFDKL